MDFVAEINRLKKEKNAVILAHYYQTADIQDVADYIGDSLGLSQEAAKTEADLIVFAGVKFMAETAKILSPNKKVVLPDINAGCSLEESAPADKFKAFKANYPDAVVISYVNCSAELKTLTDIVCTSTNAIKIVESVPADKQIIFAPDKNLGGYINRVTGRNMILWDGACMVHEAFSARMLKDMKEKYPEACVIAHPESEKPVLDLAEYIGSTTGLLKYTINSPKKEFIVATESGILHQMQKASPDKVFHVAPTSKDGRACQACQDCPHMKLNTMEKLYNCLKDETPEIILPEQTIKDARAAIDRMLEISARFGL
ncbi:quinolinate synthase NadA [Lacihabitans sp. CS3-21]|jgi:quinolinate synthase|uniref:quinolinate synthase NadA n=1 Tax=Lacihabitans sp. CS3-21 TaxID=2487332 RepID=UPI000BD3634A|nr:quinolinate synthase NadA [Lacihabitans sp. CS3-21]MCP9745203.1 quinolinate synthase NadA [Lacihabitans sp. CS3-21]MDP1814889.1 quinolinate synthase NadA [Leadbetterella sp.]OYU67883.1 MAG: quinolinate synthase [Cytophagaceae bacterium BCCC1]